MTFESRIRKRCKVQKGDTANMLTSDKIVEGSKLAMRVRLMAIEAKSAGFGALANRLTVAVQELEAELDGEVVLHDSRRAGRPA